MSNLSYNTQRVIIELLYLLLIVYICDENGVRHSKTGGNVGLVAPDVRTTRNANRTFCDVPIMGAKMRNFWRETVARVMRPPAAVPAHASIVDPQLFYSVAAAAAG